MEARLSHIAQTWVELRAVLQVRIGGVTPLYVWRGSSLARREGDKRTRPRQDTLFVQAQVCI